MIRRMLALALALLQLPALTFAQEPDDIVGTWLTHDKDGRIKIVREPEGTYSGTVAWFIADGVENPHVLDVKNPDPTLRNQTRLGLRILYGFTFKKDTWIDGKVYDPTSGSTYKSRIQLDPKNPDVLILRGYIGVPLLGRSVRWTRVKE